MLTLHDVITRSSRPAPWSEGDNIPWDEPEFSKRMLAEHLSQDHDLASRRVERIDAQIEQLLTADIPPAPARVLDLACGPGLYLNRIAAAGHEGVGIDFSPASIAYAAAHTDGPGVEYRLDDLRIAEFGSGYNTALLLYGQLNVFRASQAQDILARVYTALVPGGRIVAEPQTYKQVSTAGDAPPSWSGHKSGHFSANPHLLLTESFWDEEASTATQRFYVIDTATRSVARHALSTVAYSEAQLTALFAGAGFDQIEHRPSLTSEDLGDGLCAVVGIRTA